MHADTSLDALAAMMEEVRRSFYVRAAKIRLDIGGAPIELCAGVSLPWSDELCARRLQTLAENDLVVVPDIDLQEGPIATTSHRPRVRFFAGMPLLSNSGHRFGMLGLCHSQPRWLAAPQIRAFEDLAAHLAPLAERRLDAITIERLRHRIEKQSSTIRRQAKQLALGRNTFERAAAGARLGIWECALENNSLTWTDQVYDLFDVPRGAQLLREKALDCYRGVSRTLLEDTRNAAIAGRRGFQLDAEIVSLKGARRWIRITAAVDCQDGRPKRLFGMKQDITEQKLLLDRTRYLAEFDVMTGLANRAQFQRRLSGFGAARSEIDALLLIDLDGFKQVNDGFGHAVGDACLQEAARRLRAVCGRMELVARIGGDEFAVLIGSGLDAVEIEALAQAIVSAMDRPMQSGAHSFRIGASIGIAKAGGSRAPSDLFTRADTALYAAKAAGRGTFRNYDPALVEFRAATSLGAGPQCSTILGLG